MADTPHDERASSDDLGALDSFVPPTSYVIRGSARNAEECIGKPELLMNAIEHARRQSIVTRDNVVVTANTGIQVGYAQRGVWHEDPRWFDAHMQQLRSQEDER